MTQTKSKPAKKTAPAKAGAAKPRKKAAKKPVSFQPSGKGPDMPKDPFLAKQYVRLVEIKDILIDTITLTGKDHLRTRAENSEASANGMHMGDAGSDAYDRGFALASISRQSDSLSEIEAAIKRILDGSYGCCQDCGKPIPKPRLVALPFTQLGVDCQSAREKSGRNTGPARAPRTPIFGGFDNAEEETEEDAEA